ncbi:MAG: SDR family oxidoreductase [Actinomycetota bacterium]
MSDLTDRITIVTGTARGLGAVLAERLAGYGATVIACDINAEQGAVTVEGLDGVTFRELDVTDADAWTALTDAVVAEHGRIDVLVNNAAILHLGTIATTPPETFRKVVDVNTVGPFLGIKAVSKHMVEAGSGSIVNISSIDGLEGMNGVAAYASSKWGVRGLAKSAALELGRSGVRVNTVCNAGGNPEMYDPWMDQLADQMRDMIDYQKHRAIPGGVSLEQIADTVAFLASDAAAGITGADIPVDNGASAGSWLPPLNTL